tara:strand:- start:960 stop:1286 length:327 start_codon:yes stop_codon:yes gene_type:complete
MKLRNLYAVMLLAILSVGSYSCKEEETETLSCNEKAQAYNDAVQNFVDLFDTEDEDAEFSCEQIADSWDPVEAAYNDLCDESKTDELEEAYGETYASVIFIQALLGCE